MTDDIKQVSISGDVLIDVMTANNGRLSVHIQSPGMNGTYMEQIITMSASDARRLAAALNEILPPEPEEF